METFRYCFLKSFTGGSDMHHSFRCSASDLYVFRVSSHLQTDKNILPIKYKSSTIIF